MGMVDEVKQFAQQFQQATGVGGFNPMSLITGQREWHSIFLAPFTPSLTRAIEEYLRTGEGPLVATVESMAKQSGKSAEEAATQARQIFANATGMLVVVLADDQGLSTIPQLFFGHLEPDYCASIVESCGPALPEQELLGDAIERLKQLSAEGKSWPDLLISAEDHDAPIDYFEDLLDRLIVSMDEGLLIGGAAPLRDLAYWAAAGLRQLSDELDGDQLYACARALTLAGEVMPACECTIAMMADYEPDGDDIATLLEAMLKAALGERETAVFRAMLRHTTPDCDAILPNSYEVARVRFQAAVADQAPSQELITLAERLQVADKRSFRHDLGREPMWQVAVAEPGELFDTHAAADYLDRSIHFVAKRLENASIPCWADGDQLRIPKNSLDAWRMVMEHFQLLEE